jgi:hypothetical protein
MIKHEAKLPMYQLRFLFEAYKAGAYLTDIHLHSPSAYRALQTLSSRQYLTITELSKTSDAQTVLGFFKPQKTYFITLTDKGYDEVHKQFFTFLREAKIHLKLCLMTPQDQVIITQDVQNKEGQPQVVRAPRTEIYRGTYKVMTVDKKTLLVVGENDIQYRIYPFHLKDVSMLDCSTLGTKEEEMKKRFGNLNLRRLADELQKFVSDNFQAVKLINSIQKSKVAQGRLIDGPSN